MVLVAPCKNTTISHGFSDTIRSVTNTLSARGKRLTDWSINTSVKRYACSRQNWEKDYPATNMGNGVRTKTE